MAARPVVTTALPAHTQPADEWTPERRQEQWENYYWAAIDRGLTHADAAESASFMQDPIKARERHATFEAKTRDEKLQSRKRYEPVKAEQLAKEADEQRRLARWEAQYELNVASGLSHEKAARMANIATGNRDSQWLYEQKRTQIQYQVRQKDRQRWYELFLKDGYTPEEAKYKADEIVR
jgi:hypothetical protein